MCMSVVNEWTTSGVNAHCENKKFFVCFQNNTTRQPTDVLCLCSVCVYVYVHVYAHVVVGVVIVVVVVIYGIRKACSTYQT